MKAETVKTLKRNESGGFNIVFTIGSELILGRPSKVSSVAWALVETDTAVIIVKEAPSTTNHFAKQDIGFSLHSPNYGEHYAVSNSQYNAIFGEGKWRKIWMESDEFHSWRAGREIIIDAGASGLQDETWGSTGHR